MKTIYFVLKDDLIFYPPVLSIINVCLELGWNIVYVGHYSDSRGKCELEENGVAFKPTIALTDQGSIIKKLIEKIQFRKQVYHCLNEGNVSSDDYVWIFHTETLSLLNLLPKKHHVIFHPLEFNECRTNWKYRLLSPSLDLPAVIHQCKKIVCCEYNRAQILKGLLELERLPFVLPNKMYIEKSDETVPEDVSASVNPVLQKIKGKKVVLYQGVFLNKERRLEEFCEAINHMSDDYVLVAMGRGASYFDDLKVQYESDKILFIPFIRPPYHLLVTQKASIGVLSYFPDSSSISSVINPLYCAPNKIFEYARFGVPMISNDIPGLHYIFQQYQCGETVKEPMTVQAVKESIERILSDYPQYSQGAMDFYRSVDIKEIVRDILVS